MSTKGPRTRIPTAAPWTGYGVPDPDNRARMTYWWTDGELRMRSWPPGVRYAPLPPPFDAPNKHERRDDLTDFYGGTYFPFMQDVADAIAADLDRAAARFRAAFGVVAFPGQRDVERQAQLAEQERIRVRYQEVVAAKMVRKGVSIAAVSRTFGVAWVTAKARAAAGERRLATDPDGCRQAIVDYTRQVDTLVASVLGGDPIGDAYRAAAERFERDQPSGRDWAERVADRLGRL